MKKQKKLPDNLFFIMIKKIFQPSPMLLLTGFLFLAACLLKGSQTMNINVHDTYLVIAYLYIGFFIFMIQALYALAYFFIRRYYSPVLFWLQLLMTLPLFLILVSGAFINYSTAPVRYYTQGDPAVFEQSPLLFYTTLLAFLFIAGQFVFVLNMFVAGWRMLIKRRSSDQ